MKRIKEEPDNLHPEVSHFNPTQPRQQATLSRQKVSFLTTQIKLMQRQNHYQLHHNNYQQQQTKAQIIITVRFQRKPNGINGINGIMMGNYGQLK